ncbi:hypothetical protein [Bacillus sp. AFS017336]|uniref:Imm32 family immunity protein n=1 Tax=Bacillus sp. AFS017336 TaxID=2033489 RepID=UPI000BF004D3|nr:hypothetical protein [Bacillus sp. AFS017336]PEL10252.1 hypothetical protein CN601_14040 [Bacillus sp. AFS017336]
MTVYNINLVNNSDEEEVFETEGNNIAEVTVIDNNGINITKDCSVMISLSKNALIGLGSELIRLAHDYKDGKHFHIDPISKGNVVQSLGIMLHPESCELIVGCGEYKTFNEYINEDE